MRGNLRVKRLSCGAALQ